MKRFILLLWATMVVHYSYGQKNETILSLNSGLFSFRGASAEANSQINLSPDGTTGYTNNPFGARPGLSYGLSFQVQRITKGNFILGVSLGVENLRSKTSITQVNGVTTAGTFQNQASGQTHLSNNFINGFPFIGYRFAVRQLAIDLTGGIDIGYLINSKEQGKAIGQNGEPYSASVDRTLIKSDVRPRLQVSACYGKIGAYVGYSYGLINYRSGWVGGTNECYSELVRFGLMYKIKS
ncbi:hypothetical protein ACFSUS_15965 [Spirosoma soli]|uniref:Outer membrane protein beta-barrel domain-containing protein n=1 Tax=Spirosoma soli TaxID=1770529 RepID=A0ABW5M5A1_9BACT